MLNAVLVISEHSKKHLSVLVKSLLRTVKKLLYTD